MSYLFCIEYFSCKRTKLKQLHEMVDHMNMEEINVSNFLPTRIIISVSVLLLVHNYSTSTRKAYSVSWDDRSSQKAIRLGILLTGF